MKPIVLARVPHMHICVHKVSGYACIYVYIRHSGYAFIYMCIRHSGYACIYVYIRHSGYACIYSRRKKKIPLRSGTTYVERLTGST